MKKILILTLLVVLFTSCESITEIQPFYQLQNDFGFPQVESTMNYEGISFMFYFTVQLVLNFLILIFALFLIVLTPLLLLFNWLTYFLKYKRLKRVRFSLASMNKIPSTSLIFAYKNSYSHTVGNGFGILAWLFSSIFYISKSYHQFGVGFIEYFNFPFKVISNLNIDNIIISNIVSSEVWLNMLLIVGVSGVHFAIGWYIGNVIIINREKTISSTEVKHYNFPNFKE